MFKFLESIGLIEGHDIINLGKRKANKDKIFVEIEKKDSDIKEKVRNLVNDSSGKVYAIVKKGMIKGLYLFKNEDKNNLHNLVHVQTIFTDDVSEMIQKKYNIIVYDVAKDKVKNLEYDKVILEKEVLRIDPTKSKRDVLRALFIGFFIGFAFGFVVFDDISMGLIFGLCLGPAYSGIEVVAVNKRGKK